MKKILLSAFLLSSVAFAANAVTYAYDVAANYTGTYKGTGGTIFSGMKFYVNPGHGGFDSDDRPTPLPLLGGEYFYESEGNLDRGKHLQQFLVQNGASVKMSRTTNSSADDLNLTNIATYSSNYGGYFISLHSNGANASANYQIALYKGQNSTNAISPSKEMAYQNSVWAYKTNLTEFTYGTPRSMADYDLMGWHYGVLRTNSRPGYLVETWFHDYRPEALRFKSSLYNKFLAWQVARATQVSPGKGTNAGVLPGVIVGDVRDKSEGCGYSNYTTRGRDSYLAVNGVKVTLLNSSGTAVQTVTTDNKCNGVYAFFVNTAGTYKVRFEKSGYKTQEHSVTVSLNGSVEKSIDFVKGTNDGISLNPSTMGFGETPVGNTSAKTITVTGTGLNANIAISNSDNTNFSISATSLGATGGSLKVTYKPQTAGTHSTTIKFTSGSKSTSMVVTGTAKNPPLDFKEGWNYSENSGKKAGWMVNYANYRNMEFGAGKLYVVDAVNGVVKVLKAQTAEHLYDLNMTGVEGGALKIIDVAYVDGKLIGTNIASATAPLKVYVWDNDEAAPRVLLETTDIGGMARAGDCIEVRGNLTNGKLVYLGQEPRNVNGESENCNSLLTYDIVNGVVSKTPVKKDIDAFIVGLSPRAKVHGDDYWVMGQNYRPTTVTANGELSYTVTASTLESVAGNEWTQFDYKGSSYAFATDYDADAGNTLLCGSAVLIEPTDGWVGATRAASYPSAGLGSTTRNTSMSSSICVNVNGSSGVEMWVLVHNQGLAYYKCGTVPTYSYDTNRPSVGLSASSLDFGANYINEGKNLTLTATPSKLEGDVTLSISGTNAACFKLNKSVISKSATSESIVVTYTPNGEGSHTATLTLSSPNMTDVKIPLKGTGKSRVEFVDAISALDEMWIYSTNKNNLPSWFNPTITDNFTRDVAVNGGNLYVLNCKQWGAPTITILDAFAGTSKGNMNVTGIAGGRVALAAIDMLGDKLVGCNAVSANHTLTLYKWDSESAAPTKWAELTPADVLADQMTVTGNMTNGAIYFVATATPYVYKYTVSNGAVNATPTKIKLAKAIGSQNGCASVAVAADGTIWVDGKDAVPQHFKADGTFIEALSTETIGIAKGVNANGMEIVTFGSKTYIIAMTYADNSNTLVGGAIALVDITDGVASAKNVGIYPANGFGTTRNTQFITNVCHSLTDGNHTLNVWGVTAAQGIAYYRYVGDKVTGIQDIFGDESADAPENSFEDEPVEYYNLHGIRVNGENLAPGLYIRRQGLVTKKVLVK